jgi:hypothetical protein
MKCVWVEAIEGSLRMREGRDAVHVVQFAVDRRRAGHRRGSPLHGKKRPTAGPRRAVEAQ